MSPFPDEPTAASPQQAREATGPCDESGDSLVIDWPLHDDQVIRECFRHAVGILETVTGASITAVLLLDAEHQHYRADLALYRARQAGHNAVVIPLASLRQDIADRPPATRANCALQIVNEVCVLARSEHA